MKRVRATRHILLLSALATLGSCTDPVAIVQEHRTRPTLVDEERAYSQVAAGFVHTCGLSDGVAWCWGSNEYAQLGAHTSTRCDDRPCSRTPVRVIGDLRFVSLAAGWVQNCGITASGETWCWGGGALDGRGYLGNGQLLQSVNPVRVATAAALTSLTIGDGHACGLTSQGEAFCWGQNARGQVGDGTLLDRPTPVPVATHERFREISAGARHTCGVTREGTLLCWGDDRWGQLGRGTEHGDAESVPAAVSGDVVFGLVAAGWEHTCATSTDGEAFCWGRNDNASQLGDDSHVAGRAVPAPVAGGFRYTGLYAGALTTCGRTLDNELLCWGGNYYGAVGNGDTDAHGVAHPVQTDGGPFAAASIGQSHTCALTTDQRLWCWGDHTLGQF